VAPPHMRPACPKVPTCCQLSYPAASTRGATYRRLGSAPGREAAVLALDARQACPPAPPLELTEHRRRLYPRGTRGCAPQELDSATPEQFGSELCSDPRGGDRRPTRLREPVWPSADGAAPASWCPTSVLSPVAVQPTCCPQPTSPRGTAAARCGRSEGYRAPPSHRARASTAGRTGTLPPPTGDSRGAL